MTGSLNPCYCSNPLTPMALKKYKEISVSEHLRDLVKRCKKGGITLTTLAESTGISYDTLCSMNQGRHFYLGVDEAEKLYHVLTKKHFIDPKKRATEVWL